MKCEDAAEFVSALCDGERIPADAAEHIGACPGCGALLHQYASLGVELRRVASLEPQEELATQGWMKIQKPASSWWSKGWETMRIPRFAFALAVMVIAALGSGLVMVTARAHTQGNVLLMTATPPTGEAVHCALSITDPKWGVCASFNPPESMLGFRVISSSGNRIEMGIRAKYSGAKITAGDYSASLQDLEQIPEKQYWFRPGEKLDIDVAGWGTMVLTGELTDHIPPLSNSDAQMDPKPDELRMVSPLVLRGHEILQDFEGGSATNTPEVRMYIPGHGLWTLSLHPLEGAVEGRVNLNRVSVTLDGESYLFVTGAPVARSERVWVLHDANYKPDRDQENWFIGGVNRTPAEH
jgi:hypothetical protein